MRTSVAVMITIWNFSQRRGCGFVLSLIWALLITIAMFRNNMQLKMYFEKASVSCTYFSVRPAAPKFVNDTTIRTIAKQQNTSTDANGTFLNDEMLFPGTNGNHKTSLISVMKCVFEYELLILVTTHVDHVERRNIIRNTWGNDAKNRWKTFFLVGRPVDAKSFSALQEETGSHNDIILGSVEEDFYKLALKVLMGFEWAIRYCKFKYLLKGDDDVFVNVGRVFELLRKYNSQQLYIGNVIFRAFVRRSGKYGISKEEYSKSVYPRYCSGGGYILSKSIVETFVNNFERFKMISIDDAYIGILALKSGVDVTHCDQFRMNENENRCMYRTTTIVHHPVKKEVCMDKLYKLSLRDSVARKFL